eukprot:COSAG02_NODE_67084_length_254_cov_0.335484_1_plen_35_part_10
MVVCWVVVACVGWGEGWVLVGVVVWVGWWVGGGGL